MEEGVDKGMALMEIALVEGGTVLGVTVFADFLKALPTAYGFNLFTRAIIDQKLTFRYVYVDTKGKEIATMTLTPADYSYLKFPKTK